MKWRANGGIQDVQAPLLCSGPYVISCRGQGCVLSYRPPRRHIPLGHYESATEAQDAAEKHAKGLE